MGHFSGTRYCRKEVPVQLCHMHVAEFTLENVHSSSLGCVRRRAATRPSHICDHTMSLAQTDKRFSFVTVEVKSRGHVYSSMNSRLCKALKRLRLDRTSCNEESSYLDENLNVVSSAETGILTMPR